MRQKRYKIEEHHQLSKKWVSVYNIKNKITTCRNLTNPILSLLQEKNHTKASSTCQMHNTYISDLTATSKDQELCRTYSTPHISRGNIANNNLEYLLKNHHQVHQLLLLLHIFQQAVLLHPMLTTLHNQFQNRGKKTRMNPEREREREIHRIQQRTLRCTWED